MDFNITYNNAKNYELDFVIETENIIYLVEIKCDDKLNDIDVLTKKQKSIEYCKLVSNRQKKSEIKNEYMYLYQQVK